MLLSPKWKKSICPKVINRIFTYFSEEKYYKKLYEIITNLSQLHQVSYSSICYKGEYYTLPYVTGNNKACVMTASTPYVAEFEDLLRQKDEYYTLNSKALNWIATGLAMCHTVDCVCELFPAKIVDTINEIHYEETQQSLFIKKPTTNAKFLAFNEKNLHIERDLKKQLVINLITPSIQNAKNNVQ